MAYDEELACGWVDEWMACQSGARAKVLVLEAPGGHLRIHGRQAGEPGRAPTSVTFARNSDTAITPLCVGAYLPCANFCEEVLAKRVPVWNAARYPPPVVSIRGVRRYFVPLDGLTVVGLVAVGSFVVLLGALTDRFRLLLHDGSRSEWLCDAYPHELRFFDLDSWLRRAKSHITSARPGIVARRDAGQHVGEPGELADSSAATTESGELFVPQPIEEPGLPPSSASPEPGLFPVAPAELDLPLPSVGAVFATPRAAVDVDPFAPAALSRRMPAVSDAPRRADPLVAGPPDASPAQAPAPRGSDGSVCPPGRPVTSGAIATDPPESPGPTTAPGVMGAVPHVVSPALRRVQQCFDRLSTRPCPGVRPIARRALSCFLLLVFAHLQHEQIRDLAGPVRRIADALLPAARRLGVTISDREVGLALGAMKRMECCLVVLLPRKRTWRLRLEGLKDPNSALYQALMAELPPGDDADDRVVAAEQRAEAARNEAERLREQHAVAEERAAAAEAAAEFHLGERTRAEGRAQAAEEATATLQRQQTALMTEITQLRATAEHFKGVLANRGKPDSGS